MTKSIVDKVKDKSLIPIWQGFWQSVPSSPEKAKGFIEKMKAAARGGV